jgi:hypothetical protein
VPRKACPVQLYFNHREIPKAAVLLKVGNNFTVRGQSLDRKVSKPEQRNLNSQQSWDQVLVARARNESLQSGGGNTGTKANQGLQIITHF